MHPTHEPTPPPYAGAPADGMGSRHPSQWAGQAPWAGQSAAAQDGPGAPGRPGFENQPPTAAVREGRPWRTALIAMLTMLVLIAALGNQWVTERIVRHTGSSRFWDLAARAVTTFSWRFSPRGGDPDRIWLSGIIAIGVVLVLVLVLVALIVRGRGGFWQALFGTWASVLLAVVLAIYVRGLIIDTAAFGDRRVSRATQVLFGQLSPTGSAVAAALAFGVVVALVAALTAALSRRTRMVEATVPAMAPEPGAYDAERREDAREPWSAPAAAAVPGPIASPSPWHQDAQDPQSAQDAQDARGTHDLQDGSDGTPAAGRAQHTSVLPVVDGPRSDQAGAGDQPGHDEAATTQFDRGDLAGGGDPERGDAPRRGDDETTALPRVDRDGEEGPSHQGWQRPQG